MPFGMEKLESLGYPIVKKLKIPLLVPTECTNVTDGRTDRHRMTAKAALDASRGKNESMRYLTQR